MQIRSNNKSGRRWMGMMNKRFHGNELTGRTRLLKHQKKVLSHLEFHTHVGIKDHYFIFQKYILPFSKK